MKAKEKIEKGITMVKGVGYCMTEGIDDKGQKYFTIWKDDLGEWDLIKIVERKKTAIDFIETLVKGATL
jgi:hypothetical protein